MRGRGRLAAVAGVGGLIAALAFCFAFEHAYTLRGDNRLVHFPMTLAAFRLWTSGRLPEWTNGMVGGFPLLSDPVTAAFSPLHMLAFAATPEPHERAFDIATALHAGVLASGTAYLLCQLGATRGAALLGAALSITSPYALWWAEAFLPQWSALCWWPWLFASAELLARRRDPQRAYWLGWIALAMQVVVGYPEYALYSAVLAALWLASAGKQPLGARCVRCALLLAGGVALAAPQVLATASLVADSVRADAVSPLFARYVVVDPAGVAASLVPGRSAPGIPAFVGLAALALALLALWGKVRRGWTLAAIAVACGLLSLGDRTPLYPVLHGIFPFDRFRGPVKFWMFAEFAIAWLAALGVGYLWTRDRRTLAVLLAVAALAERVVYAAPGATRQWVAPAPGNVAQFLDVLASCKVIEHARSSVPPGRLTALYGLRTITVGNLALVADLESVDGGPTPLLGRRQAVMSQQTGEPRGLARWGVRWILVPGDRCDRGAAFLRLPIVERCAKACLLENVGQRPRVEFVSSALPVDSETALLDAARDPSHDGIPVLAPQALLDGLRPGHPGSVRVQEYRPGRLDLSTVSSGDGLLLVREVDARGWQARIDGVPAPRYPAAGAFFALRVPGGSHVVDLRYRAPGVRPGIAVSVIWVGVALGVGRWRRNRARRATAWRPCDH